MNRKHWELTDSELQAVINSWTNETGVTLNRWVATAAARKALEWAAENAHFHGQEMQYHRLMKELSDD